MMKPKTKKKMMPPWMAKKVDEPDPPVKVKKPKKMRVKR